MAMWWQREQQGEGAWGDELRLVEEAEAFLGGWLIEETADWWQPLPGWVLLNVLAHAKRGDIGRLTDGRRGWALAYLAEEVLEAAPTRGQLVELQREALVPLELALLGDGDPGADSRAVLVERTLGAIRQFRQHTSR
ncbi:MAG: hypothetical protein KGJ77_03475 [Acidobacteriota bacterium]|nr:hypothetical protein [Acidobacteriota bacterium]